MTHTVIPFESLREARAWRELRQALAEGWPDRLKDLAVVLLPYGKGAAQALARECRDEGAALGHAVGWLDTGELVEATCADLKALRTGALDALDPTGLIFERLFAEYALHPDTDSLDDLDGAWCSAILLAHTNPNDEALLDFLRTARVGDRGRLGPHLIQRTR